MSTTTHTWEHDLATGQASEQRVAAALRHSGWTVHTMAPGREPACDLLIHGYDPDDDHIQQWRERGYIITDGGDLWALTEVKACPEARVSVPVEVSYRGHLSGLSTTASTIWVYALAAGMICVPTARLRCYCRSRTPRQADHADTTVIPVSIAWLRRYGWTLADAPADPCPF